MNTHRMKLAIFVAAGLWLSAFHTSAQESELRFWRDLSSANLPLPTTKPRSPADMWAFDVSVTTAPNFQATGFDIINGAYRTELIEVAARRRLFSESSQWLFASVGATPSFAVYSPDWVTLNQQQAQAATLGWQLQNTIGFSFAVEYEYRKLGDNDDNALQIGVHYLF